MMMTDDDAKRLAEIRHHMAGRTNYVGRPERQDEFLLRLLDEALADREWRPIDENTPRNKLIWTWWPAHKDLPWSLSLTRLDEHSPHRQPTHWMPLPERPK